MIHTPAAWPHAWMSVLSGSAWAWMLMELWIWSRDRRRVEGRRSDRGSAPVLMAVIPASIFIAWWTAFKADSAWIPARPEILLASGVVLMWAGMILRLWAVLTLDAFFRVTVVVQDEHRLVTRGPYAVLRHPSYTGGLATMAGLGLALGNWVSLAVLLLLPLAAFVRRIQVEERALRERFGGSYDDYVRRTRTLVPFVW